MEQIERDNKLKAKNILIAENRLIREQESALNKEYWRQKAIDCGIEVPGLTSPLETGIAISIYDSNDSK